MTRKTFCETPDGTFRPVGWNWDLLNVHVRYEHEGRTLLGEVTGIAGDHLIVRHFNGEPWPVSPPADAVTVLERTYGDS